MILRLLNSEEGIFRVPTKDTKGKITIGRGRNLVARPFTPHEQQHLGLPMRAWGRKPMTDEEADWLLERDVQPSIVAVRSLFTLAELEIMGPVRAAVLQSMDYQLGTAGLKGFRNMLAALHDGEYALAAIHGLDSDWHRVDTPKRAVRQMLAMYTGQPAKEWK